MSAKPVSELSGKELLYRHLGHLQYLATPKALRLTERDDYETQRRKCDWLARGEVRINGQLDDGWAFIN